jgi:hypothetical protein
VRLLVVTACVTAMTTGPALACPRHLRCIVTPDSDASPEVARPRSRLATFDARSVRLTAIEVRDFGDAPERLAPGEIEMPWIWQTLREQVYARLPSYEEPERFRLVLAPVVVTSPSDTIPGVGVAGSF